MIKANGVSLQYSDGTVALKDINLHIQPGEIVYITGPSGSGKTSLLKLLLGMEFATHGKLEVMGMPMKKGKNREVNKLRRRIGPIFQAFKLIDGRTSLDNVMIGMRILGIAPRKMKEEAKKALIKVGLEDKIDTKVENLSWGQQQRVAIARAVARKPALILADEPTGNLDQENAMNILTLLHTLKDSRTTVLITTHATHLIKDGMKATHIHVNNGCIRVERKELVQ